MQTVKRDEYDQVRSLFHPMTHHLAVNAILDGPVPGVVCVDDLAQPRAGFAWTRHRFYLAGSGLIDEFNRGLSEFFAEKIQGKMLVVYYSPRWEDTIAWLLKNMQPARRLRRYYVGNGVQNDWRVLIPPDFTLQSIDVQLIENKQLKHLASLTQEMLSERSSVNDFLDKSFGVCLIHGDEIVAWCLSEYNSANRCEVGIETLQPFRNRGFATIAGSAFVEHAISKGVSQIGWHCYVNNIPSVATAVKLGFKKVTEYSAYTIGFPA